LTLTPSRQTEADTADDPENSSDCQVRYRRGEQLNNGVETVGYAKDREETFEAPYITSSKVERPNTLISRYNK